MKTTGYATSVSFQKSPVKGTLYVEVMFQTEEDYTFPWYGYMTPATMPNVVKALRACGYKHNGFEPLAECHPDDVPALLPNRVSLVLKTENGETMVQWVNPVAEKADASELAAFGGYFLETPAEEARQTPKKPSNAPSGRARKASAHDSASDDKVPF